MNFTDDDKQELIQKLDSPEREKILVSVLVEGQDPIVAAAIITKYEKEQFELEVTKEFFSASKNYFKKYNKLPEKDLVQKYVKSKISDASEILKDISGSSFNSINNPDFFLDLANFHLKQSSLTNAILNSVDIIEKNDLSKLPEVETLIRNALSKSIRSDRGTLYITDLEKRIDQILNFEKNRFTTGFTSLDQFLHGGLVVPCFLNFVSKTHVGKTNILLNMAFRLMYLGKKVVYISLETAEQMLSMRVDAFVSGFNINNLYKPARLEKTLKILRDEFVDVDESFGDILFKEFPPASMSVFELRSFLTETKMTGFDFEYIMIDYLNLLKYDSKKGMYAGLKEATEQCRALSYLYKCPVISPNQLNRGGYFKPFNEIGMEDCGESMAIPMTADVSFLLGQDLADSVYTSELKMKTLKNRISGKVGEILTFYNNEGSLKVYDKTEVKEFIKSQGLSESDLKYVDEDYQEESSNSNDKEETDNSSLKSFMTKLREP